MISIPTFDKARVLILGDVMLDRYYFGKTSRISPEAPVPIVHVAREKELPGGAGNVALNVRGLGACPLLISSCGQDAAGDVISEKLEAAHIPHHFVRAQNQPTVTKLRIVSQNQQLMRLDFENLDLYCDQAELLHHFELHVAQTDVVILSDYHKGTLRNPQPFIQAAKRAGKPVLVDPKGDHFEIYRGATLIKPNRKEFERVVGPCRTDAEMIEKGHALLLQHDIQALLITCGEQGMLLLQKNSEPFQLKAKAREVYDVTGAGDTVIAVLAACLAAGASLLTSTHLANNAASIAVSKLGAATVSVSELRRMLCDEQGSARGVMNEDHLAFLIEDAKAHGETIVMTNGCFDILHAGHVAYLAAAKALGHRLLVAVNDDASVSALKGPTRPINSLHKRMAVLAGLGSVDWVVPFSESTPLRLVERFLPNYLVKGGDYQVAGVVGREAVEANGGQVIIIPFEPGCSTTAVIEKIVHSAETAVDA